MDDFRVSTSWRNHPKRILVDYELGSDGVLAVIDLWGFCATSKTDGDLSGMSNRAIAISCGYKGDANKFISVLTDPEIGLLDGDEGSLSVHDYKDHNSFVTSHTARSKNSKMANHRKCVVKGQYHQKTEWCDENCLIKENEGKTADFYQTQENGYQTQENGYGLQESVLPISETVSESLTDPQIFVTPLPSPIPNPSPPPSPSPDPSPPPNPNHKTLVEHSFDDSVSENPGKEKRLSEEVAQTDLGFVSVDSASLKSGESKTRSPDRLRLIQETEKKEKLSDDVIRVADYYRQQNPGKGRAIQPGHADWKRITALLKQGFSVEDLTLAVDGNLIDEWHVANNKHSAEYVFRNATKVEGFMDVARNPKAVPQETDRFGNVVKSPAYERRFKSGE